jgi:uncharacterized protein
MDFTGAKEYILNRMRHELDPRLEYHSIEHTIDVLNSAIIIAQKEGIGQYELDLVKTGAVFHDSGIMNTYIGHEEASIKIAKEVLPKFDYTSEEIDRIAQMILTTQLPQNASTFLEQILCDADLDYLGRNDFFMISLRLFQEWNVLDIRKLSLKEWYDLQIEFLSSHRYFTKSAILTRREKKLQNLNQIKELLSL